MDENVVVFSVMISFINYEFIPFLSVNFGFTMLTSIVFWVSGLCFSSGKEYLLFSDLWFNSGRGALSHILHDLHVKNV